MIPVQPYMQVAMHARRPRQLVREMSTKFARLIFNVVFRPVFDVDAAAGPGAADNSSRGGGDGSRQAAAAAASSFYNGMLQKYDVDVFDAKFASGVEELGSLFVDSTSKQGCVGIVHHSRASFTLFI